MPRIDEKELKHQIKTGLLADGYLIYGNEPYLKAHYVQQLIRAAVGSSADFNLHTFDAQENPISPEDIYMAARSCPMLGGKSCVVVRDLSPDTLSDAGVEMIAELFEQPSASCVLIFVYDRTEAAPKKNNRWKKLFSAAIFSGRKISDPYSEYNNGTADNDLKPQHFRPPRRSCRSFQVRQAKCSDRIFSAEHRLHAPDARKQTRRSRCTLPG